MLILQNPMKSLSPPKSRSYTISSTSSESSSSSFPGGALNVNVSSHCGFVVSGIVRDEISLPRYRATTNGSDVPPLSMARRSFAPMTRTNKHRLTVSSQSTVGRRGVGGIFAPPNRDASRKNVFSFSLPFS